jgi:hypothetical protein
MARAGGHAVTAGSDISWSGAGETFNLRVAAVIARGGKILLCTVDGLGYWFLPGGRVAPGIPTPRARAGVAYSWDPDHLFQLHEHVQSRMR